MAQKRGKENFSLGVTQLLDELLADANAKGDDQETESLDEEALRRAVQETSELCSEAEAYFALLAQEEEDIKRESAEKRKHAENRLQETLGATGAGFGASGPGFFESGASLFDALEANNNRFNAVRNGIMEELGRRERMDDSPAPLPRGATAETFGLDGIPGLDFDKLLADIDAAQAETGRWLKKAPKAPRAIENFAQEIGANR
mmetsp:Transcript_87543/g.151080  ORF Transcript_87543/g.151080 Transcript_87543/m.151080 type:complete len:204 (-) Transcript_87543:86-697(-)